MGAEAFCNSDDSKIGRYEGREIDFEEALAVAGYGKYNIYLTVVCGLCLFSVNTTLFGVGYILPAAECDLNLSTTEKGLLTAVGFIGIIGSLYIWGALADTQGRKKIMIISLFASFICTTGTVLSASFWLFAVLQFLNGVSISGASSTLYAYVGEFHSNSKRSGAIAWCATIMGLAFLILPALAWITLSQTFSFDIIYLTFKSWRLFVFICGVPSALCAAALLAFPESPKYLCFEGQTQKALVILQNVYETNTGKPGDTFPVYPLEKLSNPFPNEKKQSNFIDILKSLWHQTIPLFKRPFGKYTFVTCVINFGLFASSSGLLLWYPDILNKLAESTKNNPNSTVTVCEAIKMGTPQQIQRECDHLILDFNVFQQNFVIGIAYLVGCSSVVFLIEVIGKRPLLVINFVVSGVCCILLTLVTSELLVDILFIGALVPPGLCAAAVNSAVVDIFPTNFKAMAVSLCLLMGRLGSVVASTVIGYLLDLSCNWTFYSFAIVAFGCTALSLFIPNKKQYKRIQTESELI